MASAAPVLSAIFGMLPSLWFFGRRVVSASSVVVVQ
jgi:hypothetical protein